MSLEKIISKYMYLITGILVVVILVIISIFQIKSEQSRMYETAEKTFLQFEQLLEENQQELERIEAEYRQTCVHNAETVARIIEYNPDVINDVEELKEIAKSVEIDEIHIFDETGRIFAGTHPQYYDYTFDSGEQMMFFKPMLEDKTLELVQDITPNKAESKAMQYSALWSSNGEFIVQIGMEPDNVLKVREKNTISYIFSRVKVNVEADYYAVDPETGEVLGATNAYTVGTNVGNMGLSLKEIKSSDDGFHETVNGQYSFCVFENIGGIYIGRVVSCSNMYQRIPGFMTVLVCCLGLVAYALDRAVVRQMDKYVVNEIQGVNKKLEAIGKGKFDETVTASYSTEFLELSEYINRMTKSLSDNNKRMSYVLEKTNLYIGTYEYNSQGKELYTTEHIPVILSLEEEQIQKWHSDKDGFVEFIDRIRKNPIQDEAGVYQIGDKYVRIEELRDDKEVFGVVIDITADVLKRREIEEERDEDLLTGLYNRRGLEVRLTRLFLEPDKLGYYGIIMIDADGLKGINDTYGHEKGDIYLKRIGEIINNFGVRGSVASRQGGDEFVLFLYEYDGMEELENAIRTLEYVQNDDTVQLDENVTIPVRFSIGYCIAKGSGDWQEMLKEADEKMYLNKIKRKKKE